MPGPYAHLTMQELEDLRDANWDNQEVLESLLEQLDANPSTLSCQLQQLVKLDLQLVGLKDKDVNALVDARYGKAKDGQAWERYLRLIKVDLRRIVKPVTAALAKVTGTQQRCAELLELVGCRGESYRLQVAVVGITSSGKSTFINGMMGSELLPEESRATTNQFVECSRGPNEEMRVSYRENRSEVLAGDSLSSEAVARLCAEAANPGNVLGVKRIEWESTRSTIPPGLVLIDSPGLDAYGYMAHEEMTLRDLLPRADIVIYLTSIRNPFKKKDLETLGLIVDLDQRVLFVLTQIDLEVPDRDGVQILRTTAEKLQNHLVRLERDISGAQKLRHSGVALVSSTMAKAARGDRNGDSWRSSGFEQVVDYLSSFSDQLEFLRLETRLRRFLAISERLREPLKNRLSYDFVAELSSNCPSAEFKRKSEEICVLAKAIEEVENSIRQFERETSEDLGIDDWRPHAANLSVKEMSGYHLSARKRRIEGLWKQELHSMLKSIEGVSLVGEEVLRALWIVPNRRGSFLAAPRAPEVPDERPFLRTILEESPIERSFFEGIWASVTRQPGTKMVPVSQHFNCTEWLQSIERAYDAYSVRLSEFRQSKATYQRFGYLGPLKSRILILEEELNDLASHAKQEAWERGASEREAVEKFLWCARMSQSKARWLLRYLEEDKYRPDRLRNEDLVAAMGGDGKKGASSSSFLLAARAEFPAFFGRFVEDVAPGARRVLLVGPRSREAHRLIGFLAGDHHQALSLEESTSQRVLLAGPNTEVPACFKGWKALETSHEAMEEMLIAAAETFEPELEELSWDAVGVYIDASRIASGLSDLDASLYRETLANRPNGVFFICGDGALFRDRLDHLVSDIPIATARSSWGRRPWFFHEQWDTRYTTFAQLAAEVLTKRGTSQELLRRWKQSADVLEPSAPFSPPFTRARLAQAMDNLLAVGPE